MEATRNDPARAGQLASQRTTLSNSRYTVYAIHTRFDAVEWLVEDSRMPIPFCWPAGVEVIRQAPTYDEAVKGLI